MTARSVVCCFWFRWAQCFAAAKLSHHIQLHLWYSSLAIQRRATGCWLSRFDNEQSNVNRKSPNDRHSTARISIHSAPAARKHTLYANNAVQTLCTVFASMYQTLPSAISAVRLSERYIFWDCTERFLSGGGIRSSLVGLCPVRYCQTLHV